MFERHLAKAALLLGSAAILAVKKYNDHRKASSLDEKVEARPSLGRMTHSMWHHPMPIMKAKLAISPERIDPVFAAIDSNDTDVVRRFVLNRKPLLQKLKEYEEQLEYLDQRYSHEPITDLLEEIDAIRAAINSIKQEGLIPFEYAVQQGKWDCVKILLEEADARYGVPIDVLTYRRAIAMAMISERYDMLPLLNKKAGHPLSEAFTRVLNSGNKAEIYHEILSHKRSRLDESPGDTPPCETIYYHFDCESDAKLARQMLNIKANILPFGGYHFKVTEAQQALIEQPHFQASVQRELSGESEHYSAIRP